jgi:molecular chaperone DnaK
MLKENADKISAADKGKIESAVAQVKEALKGTDVAAMRSAAEKLNEAWQAVSAELYKAAAEKARAAKASPGPETSEKPAGGASSPGGGKDDGPVIDAEVVDDKK